ncbi:MAG: Capsular glucan synthase [Bacteroidetes bacterium ADurb.Bin145]|nr:MAG: Capsular glucan synthase [Bacteroidetes bacterium ADurb.Bin145]
MADEFQGVRLKYFSTVSKAGFDTLLHSLKATFDIIVHNRADVVHIHSGANSIWAIVLRCAGKRVYITQFAMDWKRDKWPWYGKLFYRFTNYLTAYFPTAVVFDNVFTQEYFEKKFKRKYYFIPYGSEVKQPPTESPILDKLEITAGNYILFVGRFIPDKGVHLLIRAFETVKTEMKLVLVGGSPNPDSYESEIRQTKDDRVVFAGYVYGDDTNYLMKNAFIYVQPSLIEGLSPVILTVMGLGTPLLCSDIAENKFITNDNAVHFSSGDSNSLAEKINYCLQHREVIRKKAENGQKDVLTRFNWDSVSEEYLELFNSKK